MRSWLILNTPWQGTGNRSRWSFSGSDDAVLRKHLDHLDAYVAADPEDRWTAAVVHGFLDSDRPLTARAAWTIEGALVLAQMLPDELSELRDELVTRFSARAAGWLGDAHTSPTTRVD